MAIKDGARSDQEGGAESEIDERDDTVLFGQVRKNRER